MKPLKIDASALAKTPPRHESQQTSFHNHVPLHRQLRTEYFRRVPVKEDRAYPAAVEGSDADKLRAFWQVAQQIRRRLELLASLPFEKLDVLRLEAATKEIGVREKINIGNQTPA